MASSFNLLFFLLADDQNKLSKTKFSPRKYVCTWKRVFYCFRFKPLIGRNDCLKLLWFKKEVFSMNEYVRCFLQILFVRSFWTFFSYFPFDICQIFEDGWIPIPRNAWNSCHLRFDLPNFLEVPSEAYSYVLTFHSCFRCISTIDVNICVSMRQNFKCNWSGSTVIVLTHLNRCECLPNHL